MRPQPHGSATGIEHTAVAVKFIALLSPPRSVPVRCAQASWAGSKWLSIALTEAAQANTRSRDTGLSTQYRRLKIRRGHKAAIGAVEHSIIVAAAWRMLSRRG